MIKDDFADVPGVRSEGRALPWAGIARPRLSDRADAARGIVVLAGPPASGRSTLLADLCARHAARGATVSWFAPDRSGVAAESLAAAIARARPGDVFAVDDYDLFPRDRFDDLFLHAVRSHADVTVLVVLRTLRCPHDWPEVQFVTPEELLLTGAEAEAILRAEGFTVVPDATATAIERYGGRIGPVLSALRSEAHALAAGRPPAQARAVAQHTGDGVFADALRADPRPDLLDFVAAWSLAGAYTAERAAVVAPEADTTMLILEAEDDGLVRRAVVPETRGTAETPAAHGTPAAAESLAECGLSAPARAVLQAVVRERRPELVHETHALLWPWFRAGGFAAEALEHAVAAEAWIPVTEIMAESWAGLLSRNPVLLRDAINALPDEVIRTVPRWAEARQYVNFFPSAGEARPQRYRAGAVASGNLLDVLAGMTGIAAEKRIAGRVVEGWQSLAGIEEIIADARAEDQAMIAPALPDLRLQWALTALLAEGPGVAGPWFERCYDEALAAGNLRIAAEAAGVLAVCAVVEGDVVQARRWLRRRPMNTDGGGLLPTDTAAVPGRVAETVLAVWALEPVRPGPEVVSEYGAFERWAAATVIASGSTASAELFRRQAEAAVPEGDGALAKELSGMAEQERELAEGHVARILRESPGGARLFPMARERVRQRALFVSGKLSPVPAGESDRSEGAVCAALRLLSRALADQRTGAVSSARDALLAVVDAEQVPVVLSWGPRSEALALLDAAGRPDLAERIAACPDESERQRRPELSRREIETLRDLAEGLTMDEIATRRYVSRNTVKSQLRGLYRKLGVGSRAEAVERGAELVSDH